MKVLIAGATGLVGKELIQLLLKDESISEVHALTRRPLEIESTKLHTHIAELGDSWLHSLQGLKFDAVFCCLGTTMKAAGSKEAFRLVDFDAVVALAKFAKGQSANSDLKTINFQPNRF